MLDGTVSGRSRTRWLRYARYRGVLISNTVILGILLMLFATIGLSTPLWIIVAQAFCFGAFTSLQYTSMNTLVYADIDEDKTSSASSIASTAQQMSISFGVAAAEDHGPAICLHVDRLRWRSAESTDKMRRSLGSFIKSVCNARPSRSRNGNGSK